VEEIFRMDAKEGQFPFGPVRCLWCEAQIEPCKGGSLYIVRKHDGPFPVCGNCVKLRRVNARL
jgi:hypothetical protein